MGGFIYLRELKVGNIVGKLITKSYFFPKSSPTFTSVKRVKNSLLLLLLLLLLLSLLLLLLNPRPTEGPIKSLLSIHPSVRYFFLRNGSLLLSWFLARWWIVRIFKNWQSPFFPWKFILPTSGKFWFLSFGPKCSHEIKLQDFLKCNILKKKWMMKYIFGI